MRFNQAQLDAATEAIKHLDPYEYLLLKTPCPNCGEMGAIETSDRHINGQCADCDHVVEIRLDGNANS